MGAKRNYTLNYQDTREISFQTETTLSLCIVQITMYKNHHYYDNMVIKQFISMLTRFPNFLIISMFQEIVVLQALE